MGALKLGQRSRNPVALWVDCCGRAGLQDDAITLSASFTSGNWHLGAAYERLTYKLARGGDLTRD